MKGIHQLTDVNSDAQNKGLSANLVIDRPTASRLGITAQAIDNVLYDAFGEREIATTYTPLNQYFVVMVVDPSFWQNPLALQNVYVSSTSGGNGAARRVYALQQRYRAAGGESLQRVSFRDVFLQPGAERGARGRGQRHRCGGARRRHAVHHHGRVQRHGAGLQRIAGQRARPDRSGRCRGVRRPRDFVRELHPPHHHSLDAAVGGRGRAARLAGPPHTELSIIALIGIILLIGIVKKNAIMMIDFALEVERRDHKTPKEAVFQACLLRFRPIMMTTMAALLGGVPLAIGTGMGSELRRPLGIAIVGGLIVSQALTLYTTPVVYLYMDRLNTWIAKFGFSEPAGSESREQPVASWSR